jgi:hypothetical protein
MAINTVTDLRNTDAGLTAFTIRQNPVGGSTECHAVQITQGATGGNGAGLNVVSNNTTAPAIRTRAAGPLVQLYDASNTIKFQVSNTGAVTLYDALTLTSLSTTGNATVGGTLGVTGATTLSSTLGVTGATTLSSTLGVTGATTLTGGISGDTTLTGDLTLQGTGKAYRFRRSGSALDLDATGVDLLISNFSGTAFNGTQRSYFRLSADAQNIQVAGKVEFVDSLYGTTRHILDGAANTIAFYGATAAAKQTVTGSRGGNAALASLLTALATYGLVTDSSSA